MRIEVTNNDLQDKCASYYTPWDPPKKTQIKEKKSASSKDQIKY